MACCDLLLVRCRRLQRSAKCKYTHYRSTYCLVIRGADVTVWDFDPWKSRVWALARKREITGEPLNSRSRILAPKWREITGVDCITKFSGFQWFVSSLCVIQNGQRILPQSCGTSASIPVQMLCRSCVPHHCLRLAHPWMWPWPYAPPGAGQKSWCVAGTADSAAWACWAATCYGHVPPSSMKRNNFNDSL